MNKGQSRGYLKRADRKFIIAAGIVAFIMVTVLSVVIFSAVRNEDGYEYVSELERPANGEKLYELEIIQGESAREIKVYVGERMLTDKELDELFVKAEELLRSRFLGDNEGMDMVDKPVALVSTLPEYDMQVEWYIEDREVIDYWGDIHQGYEERAAKVTATLIYEKNAGEAAEKSREYVYELRIKPFSEEQLRDMEIMRIFSMADEDSASLNSIALPPDYGGRTLKYRVKKENSAYKLLLIIPLIIVVIIVEKRSVRAGRRKKTEDELTREYPEIISKLALLTGAGMTPYNALKRISSDGKGEAYRRLAAVIGNIQSGASERAQYASFGQIFGLNCYSRLGSMLEQNAVKGNERLRLMLREECTQALEERKARARKAGEQAGTKLLFPMLLMLLIVMAIIMVPAFMSM